MNAITIFGGGLAGLSLGIGLRREGVPVNLREAADYPRHRVCGEFISGAGQQTLHHLGLDDLLAGAVANRHTAWFAGSRQLFSRSLPTPALGLSRFELDRRLANRFQALGGSLFTGARVRELRPEPGSVWACGRGRSSNDWIALKLHCSGLELKEDLAMHMGTRGYVGVSRIENAKYNICGLFRTRRHLSPGKEKTLIAYLHANGLTHLASQVAAADIDPASISATTALDFKSSRWPPGTARIGDANTAIPPFTGNGMSMALESASIALPHLLAYARGVEAWPEIRQAMQRDLRRRFATRLITARLLHPLLLQPRIQPILGWGVSGRLLPFNLLFRLLR